MNALWVGFLTLMLGVGVGGLILADGPIGQVANALIALLAIGLLMRIAARNFDSKNRF